MKTSKKLLVLLLSLMVVMLFAACGNSSTPAPAPADSGASAPADSGTPAADAGADLGTHKWMLGIDSPKETVTYEYAQAFADQMSELSGGKMTIDVYSDGTLGGDLALLESVHGGDVHFLVQTTAPQVNFIPELAVFDLPMVYPDIQGFRAIFNNADFMEKIAGYYTAAGYKLLGYADQTFRVMSSNKKIESMADFSGVKIRTMENPNHLAFWTAIGASPMPMAFSELYTGLQQGTVVAQENPYAVIAANKFFEVQKYIIQTNHLPHILSLVMNPATYAGLNDAEKAVVDQAVANATEYARQQADQFEADKTKIITDNNTEIIPVSPELYAEMRAASQSVYDSIAEKVGQDLVDAYMGN